MVEKKPLAKFELMDYLFSAPLWWTVVGGEMWEER
jgi:hypothetical protein